MGTYSRVGAFFTRSHLMGRGLSMGGLIESLRYPFKGPVQSSLQSESYSQYIAQLGIVRHKRHHFQVCISCTQSNDDLILARSSHQGIPCDNTGPICHQDSHVDHMRFCTLEHKKIIRENIRKHMYEMIYDKLKGKCKSNFSEI